MHSSPTPLIFMDEVLNEEIVKKDNEMGGNIPGGKFLGEDFFGGGGGILQGVFDGWGFSRGGRIFLKPEEISFKKNTKHITIFLKLFSF